MSHGALLGMLPFAAVLAIVALGQTLVVQQGGIDLSVAGAISLVVVITSPTEATATTPSCCRRRCSPWWSRSWPACSTGPDRPARAERDRGHARHQRPAVLRGSRRLRRLAPAHDRPAGQHRGRQHARRPERGATSPSLAVAVTTLAVKRRWPAAGSRRSARTARAWATGLRVQRHRDGGLRLGPGAVLARRRAARRHRRPAHRLPGRRLPAALRGRGRAGRHLAARRTGQPRGHRGRRAVPEPAQPVRPRPRRQLRRPDPGPGSSARRRRRALHRRLAGAPAPSLRRTRARSPSPDRPIGRARPSDPATST